MVPSNIIFCLFGKYDSDSKDTLHGVLSECLGAFGRVDGEPHGVEHFSKWFDYIVQI